MIAALLLKEFTGGANPPRDGPPAFLIIIFVFSSLQARGLIDALLLIFLRPSRAGRLLKADQCELHFGYFSPQSLLRSRHPVPSPCGHLSQ